MKAASQKWVNYASEFESIISNINQKKTKNKNTNECDTIETRSKLPICRSFYCYIPFIDESEIIRWSGFFSIFFLIENSDISHLHLVEYTVYWRSFCIEFYYIVKLFHFRIDEVLLLLLLMMVLVSNAIDDMATINFLMLLTHHKLYFFSFKVEIKRRK